MPKGIPAREIFGIRLGAADKMGKYSKGAFGSADEHGVTKHKRNQHCRAEFYLAGWLECLLILPMWQKCV